MWTSYLAPAAVAALIAALAQLMGVWFQRRTSALQKAQLDAYVHGQIDADDTTLRKALMGERIELMREINSKNTRIESLESKLIASERKVTKLLGELQKVCDIDYSKL